MAYIPKTNTIEEFILKIGISPYPSSKAHWKTMVSIITNIFSIVTNLDGILKKVIELSQTNRNYSGHQISHFKKNFTYMQDKNICQLREHLALQLFL